MNKKVIIGSVIAAVVVAVGAWFVLGGDTSAPSSSNDSSTGDSSQAASSDVDTSTDATTAMITFTDDGFSPSMLTVKKGTVVTVKNESSTSVQFSSDDHPTHRLDPEINMSTLAPGKSGTFTAETVGTHGFHDHINDQFTGTLVVTE